MSYRRQVVNPFLDSKDKQMGKIKVQKMGILKVYSCSCGGDVEPSEFGYNCYTCGARKIRK